MDDYGGNGYEEIRNTSKFWITLWMETRIMGVKEYEPAF